MNKNSRKKLRDVSDQIQGKYVPLIKFGGSTNRSNECEKVEEGSFESLEFVQDKESETYDKHKKKKYGINRAVFSPGGKYIAGCGTNGNVYLYDLYENKLLSKIYTKIDNIKDIVISDNEHNIFVCGTNRLIQIYDLREHRKISNDSISKYVDVSLHEIMNHSSKKKGFSDNTNVNIAPEYLKNTYAIYKNKMSSWLNGKLIYTPIYNYSDLLNNKSNIININCVKLHQVNEIVNQSSFDIEESHEFTTSCLAIPNISNFMVYSGGGDGQLKIWDIRMNVFRKEREAVLPKDGTVKKLNNKNPHIQIYSHEDTVSSISFNNTTNYISPSKKGKKNKFNEHNNDKSQRDGIDLEEFEMNFTSDSSYESLCFERTKDNCNSFYMTSGYDGYIRIYDMNNNIVKSFGDEDKLITHAMFCSNNKYVISTNKSSYSKIFDFVHSNNQKGAVQMKSYLENYQQYYLNKNKENSNISENGVFPVSTGTASFNHEVHKEESSLDRVILNLKEDEELYEEIKKVNEMNEKRNKEEQSQLHNDTNKKPVEPGYESDNSTNSSKYDEETMKTNLFYKHINKQFEPTWSLFVDNLKWMGLVPFDEMNESLKKNHIYVKEYYKNKDKNSLSTIYDKESEEEDFYYEMMNDISNIHIPKFYSCIAGDTCIIPSIDTYAHVYDIYTGLHINTIHNLCLPNYQMENCSDVCSDEMKCTKKERNISFLTSVDTFPKNPNIVSTSNGFPDGSIVLWLFVPF